MGGIVKKIFRILTIFLPLSISCNKNIDISSKNPVTPIYNLKDSDFKITHNVIFKDQHLRNEIIDIQAKLYSNDNQYWILHNWSDLNAERNNSQLMIFAKDQNKFRPYEIKDHDLSSDYIIQFTQHANEYLSLALFSPDQTIPGYSNKAYLIKTDLKGNTLQNYELPFNYFFITSTNLKIKAVGNELLLLYAHNNFEKKEVVLERLDANYQSKWKNVFQTNSLSFYDQVILENDKNGENIFIVYPENNESSKIVKLNKNGEILNKNWQTLNNNPTFVQLTSDDKNLYISYSSNKKLEMMSIDKQSSEVNWQKSYSFRPLEIIHSLAVLGDNLVLAGICDFEQVKTGSIVKYSDALLFIVGKNTGELVKNKNNPLIFGTKRADSIYTIYPIINKNSLILGGTQEGPITHDGDIYKENLYSHGFIKTFHL